MKNVSWIVLMLGLSACSGSNNPAAPSCGGGQLLGSDNQCYSCNYGTPEYANSRFGYCSSLSAGGVACCSGSGNWIGSITCPRAGYPYLCSDLNCWSSPNGNGSLACVYDP